MRCSQSMRVSTIKGNHRVDDCRGKIERGKNGDKMMNAEEKQSKEEGDLFRLPLCSSFFSLLFVKQ